MNRRKHFPLVFTLGICIIWSTVVFGLKEVQACITTTIPYRIIDFTTFPDGTPISSGQTHIFYQFRPWGVIFPDLNTGWVYDSVYPSPQVLYNPESHSIDKFGILVSGGPTGFFGDIEMDFVGAVLPTFVTTEIIGSGLYIGASLLAFSPNGVLLGGAADFYNGSTGLPYPITFFAPDGETIARVIYNGGLNPAAAASIDSLIFGPAPVPPVPEPSTMLLIGSGLIGLAGYGRKKFFKK